MKEQKTVTIYTTPNCGFCAMVKTHFNKNNIKYTEYDVSKNREKAQEMINKARVGSVPVIDIDGKIIIGFNQEKIDHELGLSPISKIPRNSLLFDPTSIK